MLSEQSTPVSLSTSVIIIGAGPAGAAASIFLSKQQIPHILIDKATFPRDKVCGDAFSGKTLFVLKKADPDLLQEIFANTQTSLPCFGIKFFAPNTNALEIPFASATLPGATPTGFLTPRKAFDDFLFKKTAGAYTTTFEGAVIKEIKKVEGKVLVYFSQPQTQYMAEAPLIIGADGEKGLVRKTFMADNISEKAYVVGLRAYYKGIQGMHARNFIELHFLPELLPGYLWIFPLAGGMANVGIGMPSAEIKRKKINLREIMMRAIAENPNINYRFEGAELTDKITGWGLPTCLREDAVSGENFLLTGDAARLIDPFSGEGIGNAIYSGMLAANAAAAALKEENHSANFLQEAYDKELYRRIGEELRIGRFLQRLSNFPWLFNLVVNKAAKSPTLKAALTSMFTDLSIQHQVRRPGFYWKVIWNK